MQGISQTALPLLFDQQAGGDLVTKQKVPNHRQHALSLPTHSTLPKLLDNGLPLQLIGIEGRQLVGTPAE